MKIYQRISRRASRDIYILLVVTMLVIGTGTSDCTKSEVEEATDAQANTDLTLYVQLDRNTTIVESMVDDLEDWDGSISGDGVTANCVLFEPAVNVERDFFETHKYEWQLRKDKMDFDDNKWIEGGVYVKQQGASDWIYCTNAPSVVILTKLSSNPTNLIQPNFHVLIAPHESYLDAVEPSDPDYWTYPKTIPDAIRFGFSLVQHKVDDPDKSKCPTFSEDRPCGTVFLGTIEKCMDDLYRYILDETNGDCDVSDELNMPILKSKVLAHELIHQIGIGQDHPRGTCHDDDCSCIMNAFPGFLIIAIVNDISNMNKCDDIKDIIKYNYLSFCLGEEHRGKGCSVNELGILY